MSNVVFPIKMGVKYQTKKFNRNTHFNHMIFHGQSESLIGCPSTITMK